MFLSGESHGPRRLVGYSPQGCRVRCNWSNLVCRHSYAIFESTQALHPPHVGPLPIARAISAFRSPSWGWGWGDQSSQKEKTNRNSFKLLCTIMQHAYLSGKFRSFSLQSRTPMVDTLCERLSMGENRLQEVAYMKDVILLPLRTIYWIARQHYAMGIFRLPITMLGKTYASPEQFIFDFSLQTVRNIYLTAAAAKSLQSCPTLSDPMDCSPPGSSAHGTFQGRVPEWGATAFSDLTRILPLCL